MVVQYTTALSILTDFLTEISLIILVKQLVQNFAVLRHYYHNNYYYFFFSLFLQRVSIALAMQSAVLAMIDSV